MHSVAWRLLLSFLTVIMLGVGVVAYVANQAATSGFQAYVASGGRMYVARTAQSLADYYARVRSWNGVDVVLPALARQADDRLVLADPSGSVIADTGGDWVGRSVAELNLDAPTPIYLGQQQVGELYVLLASPARGLGASNGPAGMGRGMGAGRRAGDTLATAVVQPPEQSFLDSINRAVWLGALGASVLAVALSLLLTRQLTRPLRALAMGARRLAAGDLTYRVPTTSKDEIGEVAEAFNAMATNLERGEQLRRNLLADVAHELNTPLTVIEGTADGMLDGVLPISAEQLEIIREEAGLLSRLVADLRDLSLAEAGQLKLDRQPQDLGDVVAQAVRGFEPLADQRGLRLEISLPAEAPLVEADAVRLAQAVGNLVSNAVRHTPSGGRVSVRVQPDPTRADQALIVVSDTGEGIASDDLPYVFDRFYRADKSRSRRSGGSGLGLAIAKQIVEAHGGRIWAESRVGQGSTFYIALPVLRGALPVE